VPDDIDLRVAAHDDASEALFDIGQALQHLHDELEDGEKDRDQAEQDLADIAGSSQVATRSATALADNFEDVQEELENSEGSLDDIKQAMGQSSEASDDLARRVRGLTSEQADLDRQSAALAAGIARMEESLESFGHESDDVTRTLSDVATEAEVADDEFTSFEQAIVELAESTDELESAYDRLGEQSSETTSEVEDTGDAIDDAGDVAEDSADQVDDLAESESDATEESDGLLGGLRAVEDALDDVGDESGGLDLPEQIADDDVEKQSKKLKEAVTSIRGELETLDGEEFSIGNLNVTELRESVELASEELDSYNVSSLARDPDQPFGEDPQLTGIGPAKGRALAAAGIETPRDVADATRSELQDVDGIGEATAAGIQKEAQSMVEEDRRVTKVQTLRENLGVAADELRTLETKLASSSTEYRQPGTSLGDIAGLGSAGSDDQTVTEQTRSSLADVGGDISDGIKDAHEDLSEQPGIGSTTSAKRETGLERMRMAVGRARLPGTGPDESSVRRTHQDVGNAIGLMRGRTDIEIPTDAIDGVRSDEFQSGLSGLPRFGIQSPGMRRTIASRAGLGEDAMDVLEEAADAVEPGRYRELEPVTRAVREVDSLRGTDVGDDLAEALEDLSVEIDDDQLRGGLVATEDIVGGLEAANRQQFSGLRRSVTGAGEFSEQERSVLNEAEQRFRDTESAQTVGDFARLSRQSGSEQGLFETEQQAESFERKIHSLTESQFDLQRETKQSGLVFTELSDAISEGDTPLRQRIDAFDNLGEVSRNAFIEMAESSESAERALDDFNRAVDRLSPKGTNLSANLGAVNIAVRNLTTTVPQLVANLAPLAAALTAVATAAIAATGAIAGLAGAGALNFADQLIGQFASVENRSDAFSAMMKGAREAVIEALDPLREARLGGDGLSAMDAFIQTIRGVVEAVNVLADGFADIVETDEFQAFFHQMGDALFGVGQEVGALEELMDALKRATVEVLPGIGNALATFFKELPDFIEFTIEIINEFGPALNRLLADIGPVIAALTYMGTDLLTGVAYGMAMISELLIGIGEAFSLVNDSVNALNIELLEYVGYLVVIGRFGSLVVTVFQALGSSVLILSAGVKILTQAVLGLTAAQRGLLYGFVGVVGAVAVLAHHFDILSGLTDLLGQSAQYAAGTVFLLTAAVRAETAITVASTVAKYGLIGALKKAVLSKLRDIQVTLIEAGASHSETVATIMEGISKGSLTVILSALIPARLRDVASTVSQTVAQLSLTSAVWTTVGAMSALNTVIYANPVGALIVGVVALVTALLAASGALDDVINAFEALLRLDFDGAWSHLKKAMDDILGSIEAMGGMLLGLYGRLRDFIVGIANAVERAVSAGGNDDSGFGLDDAAMFAINPAGLVNAGRKFVGSTASSGAGATNARQRNGTRSSGGVPRYPTGTAMNVVLNIDNSGPGDLSKTTIEQIRRELGRALRLHERRNGLR